VADAASRRWVAGTDLPDALEQLAVTATVRSAGANGNQVGDELFAVRQLIEDNPALRGALADQSRSAEDRSALLLGILDGKTLPATTVLVGQAVIRQRGTVESALQEYLELAAAALDEVVATVRTARELSADEQKRLAAALGQQYGQAVQLHVVVEPELIGGLRVEIGDDVIDGTVASRLDDARRKIAG
jgi:F-type H+-transporting ATPase subunit delta